MKLKCFSSNRASRLGAIAACVAVQIMLAGSWSVQASAESATAGTHSPAAKQGSQIFQKQCVGCHNKQPNDDSPYGPPNLYAVFHHRPALSTKEAETIIRQGKGNMPAFGSVLSASEIRSVITYLRTR